nr:hypothetical protein KitaXyl93_03660 [Kitasatospora sp. Xyl93]
MAAPQRNPAGNRGGAVEVGWGREGGTGTDRSNGEGFGVRGWVETTLTVKVLSRVLRRKPPVRGWALPGPTGGGSRKEVWERSHVLSEGSCLS